MVKENKIRPVPDLQPEKTNLQHLLGIPVIVAALGYFVDIYDLLLFGIVRLQSLKDMGLSSEELSSTGTAILNWQMTGLLLGGILWGVLGDKKGRLTVLFGSILTYSLANISCGFVTDPDVYKLLRFTAGVGLAGELGAGITLVSEILPKRLRAIGTSLVAGIGLFGAVVAYFTVKLFSWRYMPILLVVAWASVCYCFGWAYLNQACSPPSNTKAKCEKAIFLPSSPTNGGLLPI